MVENEKEVQEHNDLLDKKARLATAVTKFVQLVEHCCTVAAKSSPENSNKRVDKVNSDEHNGPESHSHSYKQNDFQAPLLPVNRFDNLLEEPQGV